ncbi:hypothetical protein NXS19_011671 [Fusarium pseudograminearum]|nr:hypothetical protein NXS19_011671 [Fusarium pseudograminearum]
MKDLIHSFPARWLTQSSSPLPRLPIAEFGSLIAAMLTPPTFWDMVTVCRRHVSRPSSVMLKSYHSDRTCE